jgi:DNA-binding transcriptional regulator YhcF (GntR family)
MKIIKDKWDKKIDKPYDRCLRTVREDLRISGNAYRLYVTLYNSNSDPKVGKVYAPSTSSLANQFKTSTRTIKRWLNELQKYDYIKITSTSDGDFLMYVNKQASTPYIKKVVTNMSPDGDKNDTTIKDTNYGEVVTNMSPEVVTKMSPYIKDKCCPAKSGEQHLPTRATTTKFEEIEEMVEMDLKGVLFRPTAASPSGQPTDSQHPSMGKEEKDNTSIDKKENKTSMTEEEELRLWYYYQERNNLN